MAATVWQVEIRGDVCATTRLCGDGVGGSGCGCESRVEGVEGSRGSRGSRGSMTVVEGGRGSSGCGCGAVGCGCDAGADAAMRCGDAVRRCGAAMRCGDAVRRCGAAMRCGDVVWRRRVAAMRCGDGAMRRHPPAMLLAYAGGDAAMRVDPGPGAVQRRSLTASLSVSHGVRHPSGTTTLSQRRSASGGRSRRLTASASAHVTPRRALR